MFKVVVLVSVPKSPAWVTEIIARLAKSSDVSVCPAAVRVKKHNDVPVYLRLLLRMQHYFVPGRPAWWQPVVVQAGDWMDADVVVNPFRLINDKAVDHRTPLGSLYICVDEYRSDVSAGVLSAWVQGRSWVMVSVMQHLPDQRVERMIVRAKTRLDLLSFPRSLAAVYSRVIDLTEDAVHALASQTCKEPFSPVEVHTPRAPFPLLPLLLFGWRIALRMFRSVVFEERWVLLSFSLKQSERSGVGIRSVFHEYSLRQMIEPPPGFFWADPFLVEHQTQRFLFFEEADVRTGKGHLACFVYGDEPSSRRIILKEKHHLSYPFVFCRNGSWYMIPESAENESIDLYEAVEFPWRWEKRKTLFAGIRAYDVTVYETDDRIWLFCTVARSAGGPPNDDLFLFHADDLLNGKWIPHTANPVVRGADRARPAGRIFRNGGDLIRPSQIGIPRYGYGIVLNRIVELTDTIYREEPIEKILPNRLGAEFQAVHTWNTSGSILVMDAVRRRFRRRH